MIKIAHGFNRGKHLVIMHEFQRLKQRAMFC